MFAEVFITSNADALITGNLRHYKPLLKQNALVLSPACLWKSSFQDSDSVMVAKMEVVVLDERGGVIEKEEGVRGPVGRLVGVSP
jgi:hypothetical protein